ncbi:XdhC family protein [Salipiger bermudensis]|uniref:XdhC family protein n=1 Tax=Salipiger bermudensis TaxID=344736 RepID=UPI001C9A24E1|nr:XdhC family protein [Salipiger bermudensis]MBY6004170.1 XdhC family protein [Salipiger bermudensis]
MMPTDLMPPELAEQVSALRERDEPFAFATIVRTAGTTAAKPGAKALLSADGTILHGFLGGGCTRGAVKRAALEALRSGVPQMISVAPKELLAEKGVQPGAVADGITYARNGCPSRGTVDIFIEPCLPMPELVVLGDSPVARALAQLAPTFDWAVRSALAGGSQAARIRAIVVATQGAGDAAALTEALAAGADHVAFVGSAKKYAALSAKLRESGVPQAALDSVSSPAGLRIGAVTPEEIALSVLAELVMLRRAPRQTRRAD